MNGVRPNGVEPEREGESPISSLDRGLHLLAIVRDSGAVRISEASTSLGISPSTAHRLLQSLLARGFVTQDSLKRYVPGPALTVPPMPDDRGRGYIQAASAHMADLADEVQESCNLMMRVGRRVRFLHTVTREGGTGDRTGEVLAARACSGGRAMLAALGDAELTWLYQRSGEPLEVDDFRDLRSALRIVQREGYAANSQPRQSLYAVGIDLTSSTIPRGTLALTVSVPSPHVEAVRRDWLVAHLMTARLRLRDVPLP